MPTDSKNWGGPRRENFVDELAKGTRDFERQAQVRVKSTLFNGVDRLASHAPWAASFAWDHSRSARNTRMHVLIEGLSFTLRGKVETWAQLGRKTPPLRYEFRESRRVRPTDSTGQRLHSGQRNFLRQGGIRKEALKLRRYLLRGRAGPRRNISFLEGKMQPTSPHRRYQQFMLKFKWIGFPRALNWRCKVVPNKSLETTSPRKDFGNQSTFTKEVTSVRPGSVGFRRTPETQAVIVGASQAASGPTPAAASSGGAAQGKVGLTGQSKVNKVAVTGRLGRHAVVRQTKNGHVVANFSVAVDESYKDLLGEWHKKTAWHRVQVWEELAETVGADLQKGVRVYVEGRRTIRHWIDRENRKHCYTEIVASDVRFLDAALKNESFKTADSFASQTSGSD